MTSKIFNTLLEFEREIASVSSELNKQSELSDDLRQRYFNLQKQFKVKSSFLSGYQLRQLKEKMNKICELFDRHDDVEGSDKLVFDNNENKKDSIELKNIEIDSNFKVKLFSFSNLNYKNICQDAEGDLLIENLTGSSIKLFGEINSIKIRNVVNSQIELSGICYGSIYIDNFKGGKLFIAGDQIRIHDSSDVDIFLFSKNSCILENCKNLRIYPNKSAAKKFGNVSDESYWQCVHDFGFNNENNFKLIDLIDE